jgi:hypothetical protein
MVNPGDLICGSCGQGNDPARNFCRSCGDSLQAATVAVATRLPWWRRIFRRKEAGPAPVGTRHGGATKAGAKGNAQRMRAPKVGGLLKKVLALAVVVALAVVLLVPGVRHSVGRRVNRIYGTFVYHYSPVDITKADASSQLPGREANNVFMGDVNAFWASAAPKPGTKPHIRLTFDKATDVSLLRIASGDPANFQGSPRPSIMEYRFSDGKVHSPLQIENVGTAQKFKVSAKKATYVDLTIDNVYPVAGAPFYAAVARIEVFLKKAG